MSSVKCCNFCCTCLLQDRELYEKHIEAIKCLQQEKCKPKTFKFPEVNPNQSAVYEVLFSAPRFATLLYSDWLFMVNTSCKPCNNKRDTP